MDQTLKWRVLFVDDDPNILQGLRRMLYPMRSKWDLKFVDSGQHALEELSESPFDVIITDMRMPGMDGAELLGEVRRLHPTVSRIVLSGHSEREMIIRAVGSAHQYLSKPCSAECLVSTITRTCSLKELLLNSNAGKMVSAMTTVPSIPQLYTKLIDIVSRSDSCTMELSSIISRDIGMSAKILQLVNSDFFGLGGKVSNVDQAINLLGSDIIRSLVLSIGVFSKVDANSLASRIATDTCMHSITTAAFARQIAISERFDKESIDDCFTSGLLHDSGRLIMAVNMPEEYETIVNRFHNGTVPLADLEREAFGTSHAEVGAYLLGLWGLPYSIIETVAYHHRPSSCEHRQVGPVLAVHIADCMCDDEKACLDLDYLDSLDLRSHIDSWRILCEVTLEEGLWENILSKYSE